MAADQTLSPTPPVGNRNSRGGITSSRINQPNNTDLNVTPTQPQSSSSQYQQMSRQDPQFLAMNNINSKRRPLTHREGKAATSQSSLSYYNNNNIYNAGLMPPAYKGRKETKSLRDKSLMQAASSTLPPQQLSGMIHFVPKPKQSRSPNQLFPRGSNNQRQQLGTTSQPLLNRSNSEAIQNEEHQFLQQTRKNYQQKQKGQTTNTRYQHSETAINKNDLNASAKPKTNNSSAMITQYTKGRQRVKSLQSQMNPLQSLAAKAQMNAGNYLKTQSKVSKHHSYADPNVTGKDARHLTSQSVGSRIEKNNVSGLLNNTSSTVKNGETHIKLLVRIRPTLSTESAIQCISLQKASGAVTESLPVQTIASSLPRDTSLSSSLKKGAVKSTKSDVRTAIESQKTSQANNKILPSPSIIKLTKGYNNISFKFDQVLPDGCSQDQSFQLSSLQIVKNFVTMGSSATIFAYGQTGAGKTYTIIGGSQQSTGKRKDGRSGGQKKLKLSTSEKKGILPRILDNLFVSPNNPNVSVEHQFIMSFYEIYNDKVHDLLKPPVFSPQNSNGSREGLGSQMQRESLDVREKKDGNFVIHNLKKIIVNTRQESYIWLEKGLKNRQICATSQNAASSRSHTIFQIEMVNPHSQTGQTSKLRIVDLAGSEKYCYSNMSQDVKMKELSSINQSLSTLGQCISALGDHQRRHIPFRNCKLTKILKDSLMQPSDSPSQTIVALIVCISPSGDSYQETQSTLQFADRAKKAILNQGPMQMTLNSSQTSAKLNAALLDNMASEMEKLRRENAELKSHLQVIRQSNSQDLLQSSAHAIIPVRESIDLRLSDVFRNDDQIIMEVQQDAEGGDIKIFKPRPELSNVMNSIEDEIVPKIILRSCFKGERAIKNMVQHKVTMKSAVIFKPHLDNDESLNESIRERIEHNLKYNDDTIFDGLSIFNDLGPTNNKVHGSKDKFNARSLLSTPIDEIPVSDEEDEEETKGEQQQPKKNQATTKNDSKEATKTVEKKPQHSRNSSRPLKELILEEIKSHEKQKNNQEKPLQEKAERSQQEQHRIQMSTGDMQGFGEDTASNQNMSLQMQSLSQSNIQPMSFLKDMPSLNEVPQIQDTLNLSNDLSNDLIELGNDKQFQNAFMKNNGGPLNIGLKQPAAQNQNILIHDEDDFLKFDANEKQEDSLPLSGSMAFGDQPGNLSNILEQSSNPFSKKTTNQDVEKPGDGAHGTNDMFKAQDKLFLNDMSNIMRVEEQMTLRSLDTQNVNQDTIIMAPDQQLQSTLILDAEDEKEEMGRQANRSHNHKDILKQENSSNSQDEDTIAGMLNAAAGPQVKRKNDLQCNVSAGENMISFDASRISPGMANGNLDTSHANMKNMVGQLQIWPKKDGINFDDEQTNEYRLGEDLTEEQVIKPQEVEKSQPLNLLQDVNAGSSLFGRNIRRHGENDLKERKKKIIAGSSNYDKIGKDQQLNNDEILTFSLTNTFSTIQSLGGELNALRNNLEMSQKMSNSNQRVPKQTNSSAVKQTSNPARLQQNKKGNQNADRMSTAPVSGARGAITQSSNTPVKSSEAFLHSTRLQVRRSQERKIESQKQSLIPNQPNPTSSKPITKKSSPRQKNPTQQQQLSQLLQRQSQPAPSNNLSKVTNKYQQAQKSSQSTINTNSQLQQAVKKGKEPNLQAQIVTAPKIQQQQQLHSNIVAGNHIDQIRENYDEEEGDSSEIMTDQSMSLDLTTFSRDLQTYYSKIHSEIAQLKDILLKTQHEQKQEAALSSVDQNHSVEQQIQVPQNSNLLSNLLQLQQPIAQQKHGLGYRDPIQQRPKIIHSPQPQHTGANPKKINKDAILRAQELIEQIKTEIMSGFSKQSADGDDGQQQLIDTHLEEEKESPRRQEYFYEKMQESSPIFRQNHQDHHQQKKQQFHQQKQSQSSGKSSRSRLKDKQASSVQSFHPRQHISEPSIAIDSPQKTTNDSRQLVARLEDQMARQRNMSSQNVVSLLYKLQNELLDSIPPEKRQQHNNNFNAMSSKKLVQKHLDINPQQFEEIEGSQERSPYVVRHMQVQRQNWIQGEDTKAFQMGNDMELQDGQQSKQNKDRGNLEDTTDVNVTNTSALMFGDQSNNIIQRPLPVNRIQQKITKDRTFGMDQPQQQNRAPRPSPEKTNLLEGMISPQKQIRSVSRGKTGQTQASAATKKGQQVQGPKITGVGAGSMAADHTLTLIFDSDEDDQNSNKDANGSPSNNDNNGNIIPSYSKVNEQKRLSQIVEDYLDEENETPFNHLKERNTANSRKSGSFSNNENDKSQPFEFVPTIESQPYQRNNNSGNNIVAGETYGGDQNHGVEEGMSPPLRNDDDDREQHSFMQDESLQNLFPAAPSSKHGKAHPSGHHRMRSKDGTSVFGGLPQFTQFSDNGGKERLSEINIPMMTQKQNDLSHMSDDDLQFFLGSQGLNNQSGSMVEPALGQQINQFDNILQMSNSGQVQQLDKSRSSGKSGNNAYNGFIKNGIKAQSSQNLFEIKETDNAAKEVEGNTPKPSAEAPRKETKPIAASQKWAPPPRIKNLRSKKNKKGAKAADASKPMFSVKETMFEELKETQEEELEHKEPKIPSNTGSNQEKDFTNEDTMENVIGAQESNFNIRQMRNEPLESEMQTRPGSINQGLPSRPAQYQHLQHHHTPQQQSFGDAQQKVFVHQNTQNKLLGSHNSSIKPLMAGRGNQAQNPQLNQNLMPPHLQSSMEMQDMSRYSENFDEEDYQEQSNNSSSKQSVHKYFFQFFNPSAKLHQQQQFKAQSASQSAFRPSNSAVQISSTSATGQRHIIEQSPAVVAQNISTQHAMPSGLAGGIPRSSGKKSPLTSQGRRQQPQNNHPSGKRS